MMRHNLNQQRSHYDLSGVVTLRYICLTCGPRCASTHSVETMNPMLDRSTRKGISTGGKAEQKEKKLSYVLKV